MPVKTTGKYFVAISSVMLALLTTLSPFAIDTYLAAMPVMADFFGVGINMIEISLTIYFLGFALGNFFGGPLSDSFGRKPIALIGILLYGISAGIIVFAQTIEFVWVLRAIQAFGGGFASVTAMVFVRDWFKGKQVARLATIIGMIMMLAPLFAPVIGTALLQAGSWQTIFYFLAAIALLVFVLFAVILPESRNKKEITKKLTTQQLIAKYRIFFAHPRAVYILLSLSFAMAGMFTFITSASFMYLEYFGFEEKIFPVLFGSNVVLNVIFSLMNTYLLKFKEPEQLVKAGLTFQLLAGIVLFVAVQFNEPSFWAVFSAIVLFIGSLGMVFGNGTAITLGLVPEVSGSANAMIGVSRFIISFLVSSIPPIFHTGNLKPIGWVMFLASVLGFMFFQLFLNKKVPVKKPYSESK